MKSLVLLASILLVGFQASAGSFFGGCDASELRTMCRGSQVTPAMKKAIHLAVYKAFNDYGRGIFNPNGFCVGQVTPQLPINKCLFDGGQNLTHELTPMLWNVIKENHLNVKCVPNSLAMVSQVLKSEDVPRFDQYTGKQRSLTVGEFEMLMERYSCQQ